MSAADGLHPRPLTRIVATLGPRTDSPLMLRRTIAAGTSIVRLNFSHGSLDDHAQRLAAVRQVEAELGVAVAVLGDLRGPRIRIGRIAPSGVRLRVGEEVEFRASAARGRRAAPVLPVTEPRILEDLRVGHRVLIADGTIRLRVVRASRGRATAAVEVGGIVHAGKGLNLPDSRVSLPLLGAHEEECTRWAIASRLDFLAMSFVRDVADLRSLRRLVERCGGRRSGWRPQVVAKVERPEAIESIDSLVRAADAVMVARGDLGSEMGLEAVPRLQRRILSAAQACGRPTIVATEVLASMQSQAQPTRAEVGDLARAVLDDADAIMLSGETAVGRHPALVVSTAATVLVRAEQWRAEDARASPTPHRAGRATAALAHAAWHLARDLDAVMVLVDARDREIVRELGQNGLAVPIVPVGDDPEEIRALLLHRGVLPLVIPRGIDRESAVDLARRLARDRFGLAAGEGPTVVVGRLVHGGVRPVPPLREDRR